MANNRIYLKNKLTGDKICIAKHLGMGWYLPCSFVGSSPEEFGVRLDEWLQKQENSFFKDEWFLELEYETSKKEHEEIMKKIKSDLSNKVPQPEDQVFEISQPDPKY